jgi:hypothetical protein
MITICTAGFKVQKFYILPTKCISVTFMHLKNLILFLCNELIGSCINKEESVCSAVRSVP